MAVQPQTPFKEYTANGTTSTFPLGFSCEKKDHLIVMIDDVEADSLTWSLVNEQVVFVAAPLAGKEIAFQRNTPFERIGNYQSYDNSFRPDPVNKDFDRIWYKLQELGIADWVLGNRIDALKNYVDRKDDELKAYLLEEIHKQGVALEQLDEYYNYLMERLAQIAVDKGWDSSFVAYRGINQQLVNDGLETIADLIAIKNPQKGGRLHVKAYHSGWAVEAIYHGPRGGGQFIYNPSKSLVNDGIHCFNGWERFDYDKYYVNTDIAGFYGDGVNDDYSSFIRVKKYILTLDYWTPKKFEMLEGNFSIRSFDDDIITTYEYGLTGLITVTGNLEIIGAGKDRTNINYDFDYLTWMYLRFTDDYVLKPGIISNPLHSTFAVDKDIVSHIKGVFIGEFTVNYNGDIYFYSQAVVDEYQLNGKAFCAIGAVSWALNTIEKIECKNFKVIRNPSMQNIAFNNSQAYTGNVTIDGVQHFYCGEASALLNKCPDHSSIYCNGEYTTITNNKFVSSRASTINCAIEFHGNGEISKNEFIDVAAPIYLVNLHGYLGYFNEFFDNTRIVVKDNDITGAIYGIGYANGGAMTIDSQNNIIKLRKEKSNSTWVGGKVYVHGGIDARGLINLNETTNSNTTFNSSGDTFEQEEPTDWNSTDNYINACIATKNIQTLNITKSTFKNFKGCILVLESPAYLATKKTKIHMSGNTYIDCGSVQDASKQHLVTDSIVYISNADILDFSGSNENTDYGSIHIENETYINCKYERVITQFKYDTLFSKADLNISCQSSFLTPVSFVTGYPNFDSFTDYSFNMKFGLVIPNLVYGMGKVLTGYDFNIEYDYNVPTTSRIYSNKIIKVKSLSSIATTSYAVGTSTIGNGDKPNGLSIYDRDSVYFPQNRPSDVQKLTYNSLNGQWE